MTCPCQSGLPYARCCRPFHRGEAWPSTAEALMRSRYAAFAVGDAGYLRSSWHPETRPAELELDAGRQWTGLEILRVNRGGASDRFGTVEFRARYREAGQDHAQQENSAFVRDDGRWVYRGPLS